MTSAARIEALTCQGFNPDAAPELHPHTEGVFIPSEVASPIRKVVHGLGAVSLVSQTSFNGDATRNDSFYNIQLDGYGQGVRETVATGEEKFTVINQLGFTERIEKGTGKTFHDWLAILMPEARVITLASDGVGEIGDTLGLDDIWDHGIEDMAEQRVKLADALTDGGATITLGKSMGYVLTQKMLHHDDKTGHNLNAIPVGYVSAVVRPERTHLYMGTIFPLSMALRMPGAIVRIGRKRGLDTLVGMAEHIGYSRTDAIPMAYQALTLLRGTEQSTVSRVAEAYPGQTNVLGNLDPLAQFEMWLGEKSKNRDIHLKTVKWRGHEMATDSEGGARQVVTSIRQHKVAEKLAA